RSAGDQCVELLPTGGLPLAFALDESETLGRQQEPGRIAIDVEIFIRRGLSAQQAGKYGPDEHRTPHGHNCVTATQGRGRGPQSEAQAGPYVAERNR